MSRRDDRWQETEEKEGNFEGVFTSEVEKEVLSHFGFY